ncbi:MAG TPA: DUF2520 domain-containing protein [Flavobacteriaceae bacterium]|nr:DUF2520 domain-containing protein [Flavobacteriaceae bacterium]
MISVALIGFGNVNSHLFKAFLQAEDVRIAQVFNRTKIDAEELSGIPFTSDFAEITDADVYIIGTSDSAISEVSNALKFENRLVIHTSGGVAMDRLNAKNRRGVFYPLQTFSKNKEVDFQTIPICIEAENDDDFALLKNLGKQISKVVHPINSEERAKIHVAAVFVNNFVNYCYLVGKEILDENELPFDILSPLIAETAHKIEALTPFEAQTGPAKRNDRNTIKKHLNLLKNPNHRQLYELMTEMIRKKFE